MWKEAINSEIDSILHNHTWELVNLPPGCKPLSSKWVFKRKRKVDGSIKKYKARLVIKGYKKTEGLDNFDTYSPMTRINFIRMVFAIAINSEIDSILHNHTWDLVNLPSGCKPLSSKWVFKRKRKIDGSIDKCKARLVINGYRQT